MSGSSSAFNIDSPSQHRPSGVWTAHLPAPSVAAAACGVLDGLFPLTPAYDAWLGNLLKHRPWQPAASDAYDSTRFYPTLQRLVRDLHGGTSPYAGLEKFSPSEMKKWTKAYPSQAQVQSHEIVSKVIRTLGSPPRLMLEVGSFIGSGAVHVWSKLATLTHAQGKDEERLVICADTWQGATMMRLGSHPKIFSMKHGFPNIGEVFLRRMLSEGLEKTIVPLAFPSIGTARLLYLLGYKLDLIYVDSAHELGETLVELHMFYQLLRPGGMLMGDDLSWPAVHHDVSSFAACHNLSFSQFGKQWFVQKPLTKVSTPKDGDNRADLAPQTSSQSAVG